MQSDHKKIVVVGLFAVAMGFFEAIVVVYLRQIYYPEGFSFPLSVLGSKIYGVELIREFSTLVMLVCTGLLAGRTHHEKFAWFLFTFGIWDIIYYAGLKIFLGWPPSWFTWDILFLIPVTWIGPVLAPVICSATMILLAMMVIRFSNKGLTIRFGKLSWMLVLSGALLIFISFIQDYTTLLIREGFFNSSGGFTKQGLEAAVLSFIPEKFNWWLFGLGEATILWAIVRIFLQNSRNRMFANEE